MGQLRYICIHILIQCRSTSHCKDVQSHFLDVNVYKWMLSSTPIEVEVEGSLSLILYTYMTVTQIADDTTVKWLALFRLKVSTQRNFKIITPICHSIEQWMIYS